MKIVAIVAGLVALVAVLVLACKEGYVETDTPGVCQEGSFTHTDPAIVSTEKPPSDKMPSWQRDGITVIEAAKEDESYTNLALEKREASEEGRKKAGIKK